MYICQCKNKNKKRALHRLKSVQIRSFFWPVFSHTRAEYGDLLFKSPYSARIRKNTDRKKLRIWTLSCSDQYETAKKYMTGAIKYLTAISQYYDVKSSAFN